MVLCHRTGETVGGSGEVDGGREIDGMGVEEDGAEGKGELEGE